MASLKVRRVATEELVTLILSGGILGKNNNPHVVVFTGLVGSSLTFTSPAAATVTFVAGADATGQILTFAEVRSQIEAALPSVHVRLYGSLIGLVEKVPSKGVALSATGSEARIPLGFPVTATGKVYGTPTTNTAPCLVTMYTDAASGSFVLVTWE